MAERRQKPSLLLLGGIACLPVVFVITYYLDQGAWLFASWRAVGVSLAIALVVLGLSTLLLRDRVHGAFVGLCVLLMLLVYGFPGLLALVALVAGLIAANALLGERGSRAASRMLGIAYRALGIFGYALLVVTLVQFGVRGQITGFSADGSAQDVDPAAPDIWLVLLDGYPRADTLARDWDHTGPGIEEGLEDLGFAVAEGARSNYNATNLTLPALLEMALLDDVEPWADYDPQGSAPAAERAISLQQNRAFDLLREHGYRITSIGAGYTHIEIRAVDEFIDARTTDLIEFRLLGMSAVGAFLQWLDPEFGEGQVAQRVEQNLASLERLARDSGERPDFVFAHLPAPHPPYAFASVERPTVPLSDLFYYQPELFGEDLMKMAYRENVGGTAERVLDTLAEVVETVGDDAVIIVMSDHGARPHRYEGLTLEEAESQFAILLAARTPDGEVLFEDDALASNVFLTVANRYLGTDIPPVDRIFEAQDGVRFPL